MAGWALRAMWVAVSLAALGSLMDPHGHDPYHAHLILGGDPEIRQHLVHRHLSGPHPAPSRAHTHADGALVISLRVSEPASAALLHLVGGLGAAEVLRETPAPAISRSHKVWNFLSPYEIFLDPSEPPPRST
jgi:hypothetical protein